MCLFQTTQASPEKILILETNILTWGVLFRPSAVQLTILFGCLPESDGPIFRILTKAEGLTDVDIPLELVFHLPVSYPSCLPGVSVSSEHLTRAQCVAVRDKLLEQAWSLLSEPMVHQLVLWVQQNLRHILAQPGLGGGPGKCPAASTAGDEEPWMTLLHLDHMRAKNKYVKTVLQWASDLGLTGRLMFMGKVILILLQGHRDTIKVLIGLMLNVDSTVFC